MIKSDLLTLHRLLGELEEHINGGANFRVFDADAPEIQGIHEVQTLVEQETHKLA